MDIYIYSNEKGDGMRKLEEVRIRRCVWFIVVVSGFFVISVCIVVVKGVLGLGVFIVMFIIVG